MKSIKDHFWKVYNSAENPKVGVLELRGPIKSSRPWWEEDEAMMIVKSEFIRDLKGLGDVDTIDVFLDSGGGDVFAGQAIYYHLKKHKAKIVIHIEVLAGSAATVIASAGDEVYISVGGNYMIHYPAVPLMGYYDEEQLQRFTHALQAIKESIKNAYMTKCSDITLDELDEMMRKETWMTSHEAKEKGFVDFIEFDYKESNMKVDNTAGLLVVNGLSYDISEYKNFPVERFAKARNETTKDHEDCATDTEEDEVEVKNVQELREKHPDLVKEVENKAAKEAVTKERNRIKAIEEISNQLPQDMVNDAKFENPIDARDLLFEAAKKGKYLGGQYMNDLQSDSEESQAEQVSASTDSSAGDQQDKPLTVQERITNSAAIFDRRRRGVKGEA